MKTTAQLAAKADNLTAEIRTVEADIAAKKAALSKIAAADPRQAAQMAPEIVVLEGRREGLNTALAAARKETDARAVFEKSPAHKAAVRKIEEHEASLRGSADEVCAQFYQIRTRIDALMAAHGEYASMVASHGVDIDAAGVEGKTNFNKDFLYLSAAHVTLVTLQKRFEYGDMLDPKQPDHIKRN